MPVISDRRGLISSQARIQIPWVSVKLGDYVFGVRNSAEAGIDTLSGMYQWPKNREATFYYPNYVTGLTVTKINGQVNQYTLNIDYPVTVNDDPNFFEKVFSSVSRTRKIVFTYGDASQPNYVYKDEEAIITQVQQTFGFAQSGSLTAVLRYTVSAVSSAALASSGCYTFNARTAKPSTVIKELFDNSTYGLKDLFTGMSAKNFYDLVASDDKAVAILPKTNVSVLDYIKYLVGCMIPSGAIKNGTASDIYIFTLHDDTVYDTLYNDSTVLGGPYFKVTRTTYLTNHSDAYEIDIGYNTSTIVKSFSISNNANYSILYDYQGEIKPEKYTRKLNNDGQWEDVFAPSISSRNDQYLTTNNDITWWTKITKFPISANLTIQGLLRPAHLLQYVRLNVIFPGGNRHISSGLYIVTKQIDTINASGYTTQLGLTKISGDADGDEATTT